MTLRSWKMIGLGVLLFGALIVAGVGNNVFQGSDIADWKQAVDPGELREGHTFLENDCRTCHEPFRGVANEQCIACHATNRELLERQSTAFHADIGKCSSCHPEHLGRDTGIELMDHAEFSRIGLRLLSEEGTSEESRQLAEFLNSWSEAGARVLPTRFDRGSHSFEKALNCASCHSNQDPHGKVFGSDCISCHSTVQWSIPEYRHPSPRSMECAQCHQAPPSHYMGHFKMVSMKMAGKEHAEVNQCFACHRVTSWNDIQGIGMYKHH